MFLKINLKSWVGKVVVHILHYCSVQVINREEKPYYKITAADHPEYVAPEDAAKLILHKMKGSLNDKNKHAFRCKIFKWAESQWPFLFLQKQLSQLWGLTSQRWLLLFLWSLLMLRSVLWGRLHNYWLKIDIFVWISNNLSICTCLPLCLYFE